MNGSWVPTGAWMQRFRTALDGAFDEPSMQLLTIDFFSPDTFAKISAPGFGKTFAYRVQEYIDYARINDFLPALVHAAHQRRPKNAELAAIADDLALTSAGRRLGNPTNRSLEELIQANAKFINPTIFRERLPELEARVCRIEIPGGGGTGFLVGPDLVLTNRHVVERVVQNQARWQDVKCKFDFRQALDGTPVEPKLPPVRLDATKWLVDSRPPSEYDWDSTLGDAGPEEVDYALIRLAERVGDLPVGGASVDPAASPRGWIDAGAEAPAVAVGNQLFILQHLLGEAMQLAIGTVKEFNGMGTRVRYDANTRKGSSGAPCFNADLQLVALHHAHDSADPPQWNQGIPFGAVQKVWRDHGVVVA